MKNRCLIPPTPQENPDFDRVLSLSGSHSHVLVFDAVPSLSSNGSSDVFHLLLSSYITIYTVGVIPKSSPISTLFFLFQTKFYGLHCFEIGIFKSLKKVITILSPLLPSPMVSMSFFFFKVIRDPLNRSNAKPNLVIVTVQ